MKSNEQVRVIFTYMSQIYPGVDYILGDPLVAQQ